MSENQSQYIEFGPCGNCDESIEIDASKCPACGYRGPIGRADIGAGLIVFGVISGFILGITIVWPIVVSFPLIVIGSILFVTGDSPGPILDETDELTEEGEGEPEPTAEPKAEPEEVHDQAVDPSVQTLASRPTISRVGSRKAHAVVALLTVWWTAGIGNATYAAWCYYHSDDSDHHATESYSS
jgi:hypothetical protein